MLGPYVIYAENTLGYIITAPDGHQSLGILHASILRGSHFGSGWTFLSPIYSLRKATEQDFEDYRVCLPSDFKQFN